MSYPMVQKGQSFIRYTSALIMNGGSEKDARARVVDLYGEGSEADAIAKSAVGAQTSANGLVQFAGYGAEFVDYFKNREIVGKLPTLRRVPAETATPAVTSGASAGWVGEGVSIACSKLQFESLQLPTRRLATIVVFSQELGRKSTPEAEGIIRTDLTRALIASSDQAFVSREAATATAPAGVAYGAPTVASSGNLSHDFAALFDAFDGDLDEAYFLMSPTLAVKLNGADNPDIGARGGSLKGIPVITSRAFADDSAGARLLLIDPTRILYCDEGLTVDASQQGTVQMSDAPSQDATAGTGSTQVSLFQANAVAVRANRLINFKTTSGACAQLTGITW